MTSTSGDVANAGALVPGGSGVVTLTKSSDGPDPVVVLDYGRDVGGYPQFTIDSETGTPTLHASYAEALGWVSSSGDSLPGTPGSGADPSRADDYTIDAPGVFANDTIQGGERFERISLTTPGTVTISAADIRFTPFRATQDDYKGYFVSSDEQLNRIWYDGAYTAQLDQLPPGTMEGPWSVSDGSMAGAGGSTALLDTGRDWTDYTMTFQTMVTKNQSGWWVRSPSAGAGYLMILDADDTTQGGANNLQQLVFGGSNGLTVLPQTPTGETIKSGTWHTVATTVSGTTVSTSIDGHFVASFDSSTLGAGAGHWDAGSVGFRLGGNEQARYRDLSVTDPSGRVLYQNDLSDPAALNDFEGASPRNPLSTILDGARRDRAIWVGDLNVTDPVVFYTTAADEYVHDSIQLLGSYQAADGEGAAAVLPNAPLGSFPPANGSPTYSASYSIYQVLNTYDYYLYSGDAAFTKDEWPIVQRELAWNKTLLDSRGLLVTDSTTGADWDPDAPKTGAVTEYNALYYEALVDGAKIARLAGDLTAAADYTTRAEALKGAINQYLFDPGTGGYDVSDQLPNTIAQDGDSLAVAYGIAPEDKISGVFSAMHSALSGPYGDLAFSANATGLGAEYSAFASSKELQALFGQNDTNEAIGLIRKQWGQMADPAGPYYTGTTWEHMQTDGTPGPSTTSLAHGWSAGATSALSQYVLGLSPTSPGYATWSVAPQPGDLGWAEGQVATPHGPLGVKWGQDASNKQFQMNVTAPDETTGTISVPLLDCASNVLVNGAAVWTNGRFKSTSGITAATVDGDRLILDVDRPGTYSINSAVGRSRRICRWSGHRPSPCRLHEGRIAGAPCDGQADARQGGDQDAQVVSRTMDHPGRIPWQFELKRSGSLAEGTVRVRKK